MERSFVTPRSASERLRELGPPFDLTETHSWIEVEGVMREINSMVVLYDSLPLIADVVEAAEREHPEPHNYWAIDANMNEIEDCPTCAALTALREALEEK
jgi:hypothetical protein